MTFDEELADDFEAALEEFDSPSNQVFFEGLLVEPTVVDETSAGIENAPGGRKVNITATIHLRESDRVDHGIDIGSVLELRQQGYKVRVEVLGHLAAGERTLKCGPVNQR